MPGAKPSSRQNTLTPPKGTFDARTYLFHESPIGRISPSSVREKGVELTGERLAKPLDRVSVRLIVALAAGLIVLSDWVGARAFDFFGLWGSDETPPPISQANIPYIVTVEVTGDDSAVKTAVRDASSLYRLRKDAPPDGEALARRAQSDFAPVIDALWGAGYYNAAVTISIDGATLAIASNDVAAFARAAEAYRNRAPAPVVIKVDPNSLFKLRSIRVLNAAGAEFSEAEVPRRIIGLKPGEPAVSTQIRAAETRVIDYFRKQGRPLAKVQSVAPVVDHAQDVMDVTLAVDPSVVAPFGEATIHGPQTFDPAIVRSFLYIRPGDPYTPAAIADARNSVRQIPAVGGVRITEGDGARRLRSAALSGRRRGSSALRDRRVSELFDNEWPRGPSLLGRP